LSIIPKNFIFQIKTKFIILQLTKKSLMYLKISIINFTNLMECSITKILIFLEIKIIIIKKMRNWDLKILKIKIIFKLIILIAGLIRLIQIFLFKILITKYLLYNRLDYNKKINYLFQIYNNFKIKIKNKKISIK